MSKIGLVLEGGGMRGLYTIGVLDCLMDEKIQMEYVVGVSAGACNGVSYVSGQRGRSYRVNTRYLKDKRYLSLKNLLFTRSLFGMDFLFSEIPSRLEPFDYDAFLNSPAAFFAGVTDVETGGSVYFGKEEMGRDTTILRASSSIPVFSPMVPYQGRLYLDGGTSDPIPFRKALSDGCEKVVVVLTRERSFVKRPESLARVYRRLFREHPSMIRLLDERHKIYNEAKKELFSLEKEGKALLLAPKSLLGIGRFEKREEPLKRIYEDGYRDTAGRLAEIKEFLK